MPLDNSNFPTNEINEITSFLIEGKENLLKYGWHPGPGALGKNGKVCMLSANSSYGRNPITSQQVQNLFLKAIESLGYPNPTYVSYFNDTPNRTFSEIISVYNKAIELSYATVP